MTETLTKAELLTLPPVVDLTTAASALGLGRSAAYELVRAGKWPTPILRLGRAIRVPTAPLLLLLGVAPAGSEPTAGAAG